MGLTGLTATGIASTVLLTQDIKKMQSIEKQAQEVQKEIKSNFQAAEGTTAKPEWTIKNLQYIKDNLNYKDQYRVSDMRNIFRTTQQNSDCYIQNVKSASNIGDLNATNSYTNMKTLDLINMTNAIDQIKANYKYRYATSSDNISGWSSVALNKTKYYTRNVETKEFQDVSSIAPSFVLGNVINTSNNYRDKKINDMYELKKIDFTNVVISPEKDGELKIPENNFYRFFSRTYSQQTNDGSINAQPRKEIFVTWKNDEDRNKMFIDNSTAEFWYNILMSDKFANFSRIVVEPANLIIYKSTKSSPIYNVPLNDTSMNYMFSSSRDRTSITLQNWADSCINNNPAPEFDFRDSLSRVSFPAEGITNINIPRIITVDTTVQDQSKKFREPTLIPACMMYSQKPSGNSDRNWGRTAYTKLTNLMVSMDTTAPNYKNSNGFNIFNVNDTRLKSEYTNANSNTGINRVPEGSLPNVTNGAYEIFANQFYVAPNLKSFSTTNIDDFFNNFNFINELPIFYKFNEPNFSMASYHRYEELTVNYLPEDWNRDPITQSLNSSFNGFSLKNSIFYSSPTLPLPKPETPPAETTLPSAPSTRTGDSTSKPPSNYNKFAIEYLNNYFNYLSWNRSGAIGKLQYDYYNINQNQWYAKTPTIEEAPYGGYRYDFIYGVSDMLQQIVYPFSMFPTILNQQNQLYIQNDYFQQTYGTHISRFVDPTTATIVCSNEFITRTNTVSTYPLNPLTNDIFASFIDSKRINKDPSVIEHINITFDDWANNAWTGLDESLDIIRILAQKNVVVDNFEIPRIIMLNNNSIVNLQSYSVNHDLVVSIILISVIVVVVIIEVILIIKICRTPGYYKWSFIEAQEDSGY